MRDAVVEAAVGLRIEMPDGSMRDFQVLALGDALRFIGILLLARAGDGQATLQFLDEFPEAIGLEPEDRVTPGEVFGLADRFFWSSRIPDPENDETARTTPTESSTPSTT